MLDKRSVLLVKDEVTYNTDSVPVAATDAVLVEDLNWAFANTRMHARKPVRPSLAMLASVYAGALMTISGKCEVKGAGAAGTAPEVAPILRACGFAETIVASTSVTYKPTSTQASMKSASVYFFDDGVRHNITGCRGKVTFDFSVGAPLMASFELTGHYAGYSDVALGTPTYDSVVPVPLLGAAFTVGGYAAVISKLALDMGIEVSIPESLAATDGYGEVQITGRNATGSCNPLRVTKATKDFIALWQAKTAQAIAVGPIGATAGNIINASLPACTLTEVGRGNQANVGTYELKFEARESAGDDEVSLAFT